MKRLVALLCLAAACAAAAADFYRQLTPEERRAAGIDQLTPEQQAALDAVVARFAREDARAEVESVRARAAAEAAEQARREAEARRVQAEAEKAAAVRQAQEQVRAEAKAEQKRRKVADAGLAVRSDDDVIRTRIAGEFRGWGGHTTFPLENGQVWQQTDSDSRYFPRTMNPEVELIPNGIFGWKLNLVAEGMWVRVKRVK